MLLGIENGYTPSQRLLQVLVGGFVETCQAAGCKHKPDQSYWNVNNACHSKPPGKYLHYLYVFDCEKFQSKGLNQ
jgi:hypothetical protein